MKRLKIGIFIDQLVTGGVQKTAIQEAIHLKKLGHNVTLYVLIRWNYKYQYKDLASGLNVVFLSDYNPPFFRSAIRIPYFGFLTHLHIVNPFFVNRYKFLKKLDFIISHGTTTCITVSAISKKLKIPYMAFVYDPMMYILENFYSLTPIRYLFFIIKPLTRHYEYSFLTSAALVATLSKVHQKFIKDVYQIDPIIIHPGCIPPKFTPKKTDNHILGYTRWEMKKNPQLFLWLSKKLPKAKFILAGTWNNLEERKIFQYQIRKNKLGDKIKLITSIDETEIKNLAAKSIVWVHPNFEAFGMAGLEMASLGLPIIIPNGSGVTEIFEEGKHGFFPKLGNKKSYLSYIKFILENPKRTRRMGKEAAEVAKSFTWNKHALTMIKTIQNYLQKTKVVCIANAFVATYSTGGGDQFIIEIARRIPKNIYLTVVLPQIGLYHWQKANIVNENIRFIVLPSNIFDNIERPFHLFLAYLIRTFQTIFILPKLSPFQLLHTATDIIPDVIPAFLYHKFHPEIPWATRFFHFFQPPHKRQGRWWVNTGSYLLQQLSLKLMIHADLTMIDNINLKYGLQKRGIDSKKIELHTGGVDIKSISKIKFQKSLKSDALFIGRLQAHKGVFDAIEIWKRVIKNKPLAKLIMIGYCPSEMMERLKAEIKNANLEKNIHFTGYLHDRNDIYLYSKSSKILLFLDHEAGFGLVVPEAMATGLPVITYNLPIFGTVYKNGFMTAPLKDLESISKNVVDLLNNKKLYQTLSNQAKQEALKYDWSRASRKFYQTVLQLT